MKNLLLILVVALSMTFSCQDKISKNDSASKMIRAERGIEESVLSKKESEQISKDCYSEGVIAMSSEKTFIQAINKFNCSISYSEKYKKESLQYLITIYDRLGDSVQYKKHVLLFDKMNSINP